MKHPRFGVTQTLLGGPPDCNRRTIVDSWNKFEDVCVFNQCMDEWDAHQQVRLDVVLCALNDWAKGV